MFFFRKHPYVLQILSLTGLLSTLQAALAPTIAWALTAGPTAPEFSSFEPVDTTDMVNLSTGDFTYSIPLLEVPGPEGGYPLALSYHAGIGPDEESSWVGLGWSLNPGSLNRYVNGIPDDMNGSEELIRDIWEGGETRITSVGIGIGWSAGGGQIGVGFGMAFGNDTYKGRDVGSNVSMGYTSASGVGVSIYGGSRPFGDNYIGVGLSAGTAGYGVKSSVGIGVTMTGGKDVSLTMQGSMGYGPGSIVGTSIDTKSGEASGSVAAVSYRQSTNRNAGNVTVKTRSLSGSIPVWKAIYVSMGSSHTRYFLDQIDNMASYGSLYGHNIPEEYDNVVYDCYPFKASSRYDFDPDVGMGGSMPAFDMYQVLGQGISGSIQPYIYEHGSLYRVIPRNQNGDPVKNVTFDPDFNRFGNRVGFRFVNDFSASFVRDLSPQYPSSADYISGFTASIGEENKSYTASSFKDFNKDNGMLAGSRHVEWFTNEEIRLATMPAPGESEQDMLTRLGSLHGFIPDLVNRPDYLSVESEYGQNVPDNIGGFLVTNQSGVSYHYSIPVYNFQEYSENVSSSYGQYSRKITKSLPYAYTWLMTGITGPDYVDRPPYGVIDENDWGYWVKFEYGKWTDKYIWRTPSEGVDKDLNSQVTTFTSGRKELYYLNAVQTRSHTALFVKDLKRDGKGIGNAGDGGFEVALDGNGKVVDLPAATLKLNRILLFTNRELKKQLENIYGITSLSELQAGGNELYHIIQSARSHPNAPIFHNGKNVLDEDDLGENEFGNAAIKQIVFDYGYDLCPQTPNSFDINYSTYVKSNASSGKLSLNTLKFLGRNAAQIIPATSFEYALPSTPYNKNAKDIWGMYKSDYTTNETDRAKTSQITTVASAESVHAWSLSKIHTPLGATIHIAYESDYIKNSALMPHRNLVVKNFELVDAAEGLVKIQLHSSPELTEFEEYQPGNYVHLKMLLEAEYATLDPQGPHPVYIDSWQDLPHFLDEDCEIISVINKEIVVQSTTLYNRLETIFIPLVGNQTTYLRLARDIANVFTEREFINEEPGGGIRVKSISVRYDNVETISDYSYSGGTTAYEPVDLNIHYHRGNGDHSRRISYSNKIYPYYFQVISSAGFLPPPGVIYQSVVIQDKIRHYRAGNTQFDIEGKGSVRYDFSVFDEHTMMPGSYGVERVLANDDYAMRINRFRNLGIRAGLLQAVTYYSGRNAAGNMLSRQENSYLHENLPVSEYEDMLEERYNSQGRVQQVFFERKEANGDKKFLVTSVEELPVINTGTRYFDGKKGIWTESRILSYDYYSGNPTVTVSDDAYGNTIMSEILPAHRAYSSMGIRVVNPANKHMLEQVAASTSYTVQANVPDPVLPEDYTLTGLIGAVAMTWSNELDILENNKTTGVGISTQSSVWKMSASYSWTGDDTKALNSNGTHDLPDYVPFSFSNLSANSALWLKESEVLLVSQHSRVLESWINGNIYGASLFDPTNTYVIASGQNTRFAEMAYSGCEFRDYYTVHSDPQKSILEGGVKLGQGIIVNDPVRSHTGTYSLKVDRGQEGFSYSLIPQAGKAYRASVWVYLPGEADDDQHLDNARLLCRVKATRAAVGTAALRDPRFKANGHYLINLDIDASLLTPVNGQLPEIEFVCLNHSASRDIYFDDFRVHPLDAGFTSYVYDLDRGLITHILDNENLYFRFEYDAMGNLIQTFRELFYGQEIKVSEQRLNFGKAITE